MFLQMRINKISPFFRISLSVIALVIILSGCSKDTDQLNPTEGEDVEIGFDSRALPPGLSCALYIFQKVGVASEYKVSEVISFGNENTKTVRFQNSELKSEYQYRFLFLVEPSPSQLDKIELSVGTRWTYVRLGLTSMDVKSGDYYYGILDKSGNAMPSSMNVPLKRLLGQPLTDIYKVDAALKPDDISEGKSVLDRVYQITATYKGLTKEIGFYDDHSIRQFNQTGEHTYNIVPVIENAAGADFLTVEPSQPDKRLYDSRTTALGGVYIEGPYGFPTTDNLQIDFKFDYYHTTPKCGNPSHVHDVNCFDDTRSISLKLPSGSANKLSLKPGVYTVNNVKIEYDHIIDVGVNGGFSFDLKWESDK